MVTVMGGLVLCNNTGETRRWTSGDLQCYSYFNHRRSACLKFEPELFPSITDEAIANASALVGDRNGIFHCRCSKLRWRSAPPWEENDALGDCDIMTPGIVLWNAGFVINSMLLATLIVLGFGLARRVQARTKRCWCRTSVGAPLFFCLVVMAGLLIYQIIILVDNLTWNVDIDIVRRIESPVYLLGYAIWLPLALVTISLRWAQVASNAKAFRKVTPRLVRMRAHLFIGAITVFNFLVVGFLGLDTIFGIIKGAAFLGDALLAISQMLVSGVIITTYVCATRKLSSVLRAMGDGSHNSGSSRSLSSGDTWAWKRMAMLREASQKLMAAKFTKRKAQANTKEEKLAQIRTASRRVVRALILNIVGLLIMPAGASNGVIFGTGFSVQTLGIILAIWAQLLYIGAGLQESAAHAKTAKTSRVAPAGNSGDTNIEDESKSSSEEFKGIPPTPSS